MMPLETNLLRDVPYTTNPHQRQTLDLYLPQYVSNQQPSNPQVALPLVIWIHGGAWMLGSKESNIPLPLLAQGYAVASINYRLSEHAHFPAQLQDCKAAVRWLRAHAEEYSLDPTRFAAFGSSAGGHLVALLGAAQNAVDSMGNELDVGDHLDQSSAVQAVVNFYGPTDFLQMDARRLPDGMIHDEPESPESKLVGGPIQENPDKVAAANPITYISAAHPPFLIVHGDTDPLVPHHQSVLLDDALRAAGQSVLFYTVKGGGHGRFEDPEVPELVKRFLKEKL